LVQLESLLKEHHNQLKNETETNFFYDPFTTTPEKYFTGLRKGATSENREDVNEQLIRLMFQALDQSEMSYNTEKYKFCLTCQCIIECALLDLWGKVRKQPVSFFSKCSPTNSHLNFVNATAL
jgi:hypothetical protein